MKCALPLSALFRNHIGPGYSAGFPRELTTNADSAWSIIGLPARLRAVFPHPRRDE